MKTEDSVWQGHFGYWQSLFIRQNILTIGHTAWSGYINAGRGVVCCEITVPIRSSINWSVEAVPFDCAFVPQSLVAQHLQAFELGNEALDALLAAIATSDPTQAMVVIIIGNGVVDINLLQNLAISPADCHQQVQRRWAEFQSDLTPHRTIHE